LSFRQVSAGLDHACGVTTENRAYCWGYAQWGQLGNGEQDGPDECNTHPCSSRPLAVAGGLSFRYVSAGWQHTCAITTDDRAYCWGRNFGGQLGDGTTEPRLQPVAVMGALRRWREVATGNGYSCGVTMANLAFCWGTNNQGQLGTGSTSGSLFPVRVAGGLSWSQVTAAANHACGVTTTSQGYCWGANGSGKLGDGTTTSRRSPRAVAGGLLFRQIDAGFGHTCGTTTEFRPYCWGSSTRGALGDNSTTVFTRLTPTRVYSPRLFDHVSAGDNHSCGITRAGVGLCWGVNLVGQLGDGTQTDRRKPTLISGGLSLAQIVAEWGFSCAVARDARAYCWGDNSLGQLGDGTAINRSVPTPVAAPM
jgi:alpha-tubulin suppressor-like RCC1 family protein